MQTGEDAAMEGTRWGIEAFEYPAFPEPPASLDAAGQGAPPAATEESAGIKQRIEDEARRAFEAGRAQGVLEGRRAEKEEQAAARIVEEKQRTEQRSALIRKFDEARDHHLQAVEHEVVKLALAVAARILRREAQMDPLLLTGAVRVALGQLAHAGKVQLRVPTAELELWTEAIAHLPNLTVRPTVVANEEMHSGDCVIESELGTVDLGLRAQLAEIERGFFDRLDDSDKRKSTA